ncbi:MAG: oligopeptide transporter, OPT family [Desulfovibrionaceae bacterium]|nr:oligopeptide transporter, OPT family [Desulfovibrionaceae bacterium]
MKAQTRLAAYGVRGLPELTLRGILLGAVITVIFTASNVYLGLKVGMTFNSSIPAAVISMAILRMFHNSNVLENNMVQTQASAAGTLSAVIFALPGLLMMGYWAGFPLLQTLCLCACGGCLGVLFTIPLRRALVVNPYPEGRAAAEILKVGSENPHASADGKAAEKKSTGMKDIVLGTGLAGLFSFCANGLHVFASEVSFWFRIGPAATQVPLSFSLALLGAGYLIGITAGIAMLVGVLLAWFGFVPYLQTVLPIPSGMGVEEFAETVWVTKVRYIGAGCIGLAAIWTLLRLSGAVVQGIRLSLSAVRDSGRRDDAHLTDTDMSVRSIGLVFLVVLAGLAASFGQFVFAAGLPAGMTVAFIIAGVVVSMLVGFLVAAACGYMAGLLGSSSSPISGIGIIGVIVSSLVVYAVSACFGLFGMEGGQNFAIAMAIFMTSVIVAIACVSNDNMQDLKTGQLVEATPKHQQIALIIGVVVGAVTIAPVLNLLYQAYGFTGALPRPDMDPRLALSAPQATLMKTIAEGIFNAQLEWSYIFAGLALCVAIIVIDRVLDRVSKHRLGLPPIAVGLAIYLPPSVTTPIILGTVVGWFMHRHLKKRAELRAKGREQEDYMNSSRHGVLIASGFIVGDSLVGVLIAVVIVVSISMGGSADPLALVGEDFGFAAGVLGVIAYVAIMAVLIWQPLRARLTRDK